MIRTSASDVSCLAGLKNLEELYIADTSVSDVSPLEDIVSLLNSGQLSNIKWLRINGDRFNDESFSLFLPRMRTSPDVK